MDKTEETLSDSAVLAHFRSLHYIRHNQRRQEHLASLGLDLTKRSVLELGAGIGDHTTFFIDRGCDIVSLEARSENCRAFELNLKQAGYRRPIRHKLLQGTIEDLDRLLSDPFDVVYCYGLLYHLPDPDRALTAMAHWCQGVLLLETCVSYGHEEEIHPVEEIAELPSQSIGGIGCRPTRPWVFSRLQGLFDYVYMPRTQPVHEEFPIDWEVNTDPDQLSRAVFIASRIPLENSLLLDHIPMKQDRR